MKPQTIRNFTILALVIGLLSLLFASPLNHLWMLSLSNNLYSHVVLIPFIAVYLAWDKNRSHATEATNRTWTIALIPFLAGAASLLAFLLSDSNPEILEQTEDYVAYSVFTYICFIITTIFLIWDKATIRNQLFAILFLLLITPLPAAIRETIQTFFQYTSAEVAYWFISVAGIPIQRDGLIFTMPTIVMEVAPQCSGLRSSLILFITSLIASYLFLKSPWKRAIFVSLFIPIGILRNAIRILVLAWQCFHISPEMIHGWFHKQGGQPLFAVTLIPLFLVLWLFHRPERKSETPRSRSTLS